MVNSVHIVLGLIKYVSSTCTTFHYVKSRIMETQLKKIFFELHDSTNTLLKFVQLLQSNISDLTEDERIQYCNDLIKTKNLLKIFGITESIHEMYWTSSTFNPRITRTNTLALINMLTVLDEYNGPILPSSDFPIFNACSYNVHILRKHLGKSNNELDLETQLVDELDRLISQLPQIPSVNKLEHIYISGEWRAPHDGFIYLGDITYCPCERDSMYCDAIFNDPNYIEIDGYKFGSYYMTSQYYLVGPQLFNKPQPVSSTLKYFYNIGEKPYFIKKGETIKTTFPACIPYAHNINWPSDVTTYCNELFIVSNTKINGADGIFYYVMYTPYMQLHVEEPVDLPNIEHTSIGYEPSNDKYTQYKQLNKPQGIVNVTGDIDKVVAALIRPHTGLCEYKIWYYKTIKKMKYIV